jgi:hypothetical protein
VPTMLIKINNSWQLRTDSENWILEEKVGLRKDRNGGDAGVPNWKVRGFYRTAFAALRRMIELRIRLHDGEYPPSALEPLYTFLNEIEGDLAAASMAMVEAVGREHAKPNISLSRVDTTRVGEKASQRRLAPGRRASGEEK